MLLPSEEQPLSSDGVRVPTARASELVRTLVHRCIQLLPRPHSSSYQALDADKAESTDEPATKLLPASATPPADRTSPVSERTAASYWLVGFLPSWLHAYCGFPLPVEVRRPTDYLDGLRGVASLIVLFDHSLLGGLEIAVIHTYGTDGFKNAFSLPFVRTLFSGTAMVAIFYVISGYVLSARCIVAMRAHQQEKVCTILTSMSFRRAIRLFVPSLVASLLSLLLTLAGAVTSHQPGEWTVAGELNCYGRYLRTVLFDVWHWDDAWEKLANNPDFYSWYAPQLWTIPMEFASSMVLFMMLIATARCSTPVRLAITISSIVALLATLRWHVALFFAGMALAEISVVRAEREQARQKAQAPTTSKERRPRGFRQLARRTARGLIPTLALGLGWYLTGFPLVEQEEAVGYSFLVQSWHASNRDRLHFFVAVAASLVVGSISFLPLAQRVFTTSIARYLGKISYALYLVHLLIFFLIRDHLWKAFGVNPHVTGDENATSWGYFASLAIMLAVCIWAADIFQRAVDAPTVRFAKWLERQCFVK